MMAAVIAVIGTLCGSALTGLIQYRVAAADRRADRADKHRDAQVAAMTDLVAALADHRRAMSVRADLRFSGAGAEAMAAARAESHVTRSAITAPLTAVMILAPDLAETARRATDASYALRDADDKETLDERRRAALAESDELVRAFATYLAAD